MFNKDEKIIFYISNLGKNSLSIIDGETYKLIKDIEIGPRPQDVIVDEENNLYIASDRSGKVVVINDLYNISRILDMPNNGNIKVDLKKQVIYVSNTEEVNVYNLNNGEIITRFKGFIAADGLQLDKDKKILFILDVFKNEIKAYDTSNYTLKRTYRDVGNAPTNMIMDKIGGYIYISNKGINKGRQGVNISILDLKTGEVSYIELSKEDDISFLEQEGRFIYIVNKGLNRIEVIDILKRRSIASINGTCEQIQRLKILGDKKVLAVTSTSNKNGALDLIDITSNKIYKTFNFEDKDNIPWDIGFVIQKNNNMKEEYVVFKDKLKEEKDEGITILAKKIVSTYQEKLFFPEVIIPLSNNEEEIIFIEDIIFDKCEFIEESKDIRKLENKKSYSILTYDFKIPYYINVRNNMDEKYSIKGKIIGSERASLYIPKEVEDKGYDISVSSISKLTTTPEIIKKSIRFDFGTLISTKVTIEEEVFIPFYNKKGEEINE